ncbi:transcriptional regulator [Acidithiobacillus sp. HP-6]|jgi:HTH-type transcriptional regulator/antitoxin HigA|uniref:Transcriptional regulator n=1 Tax=Acidithiobacillus concretivorus TaxID=3063952 RepID=A0ABS5ZMG7_9PROT|nr:MULTISPECIES: transcriptional regulator [Acidithiobacillus]MBE7563852.1 transcriptional regulator [Acidithiobacillus sp. HP-6]MBE7565713.1 transcriptional regulator [Acidithiobacillus sp. HP-11]MBE7570403.1 transcriptional regulator [Acidithiobacillus sp. HP-2]MBU2737742.1 transcriptional regulator [Acidithiobacillus concretivorus]
MEHWRNVAPLLVPPADDADYQSLVESLDAILDAGGADENSPLAGLASMIGYLIEKYGAQNYPMPSAMSSQEVLAFLMAQHHLRQSDLPEIGNQAKVSDVLSGKRKINLRQANALAKRFGLSIEVFAGTD